jgi:hypothetical protein
VTTALEAGLEVLPLLGLLLGGQDLARRRRKIRGGVRIGDTDVKDDGVTTAPEALDTGITSVVGPVHWVAICIQRRLSSGVCRPPYVDEGFGEYSSRSESLLAEACPFAGDFAVAKVDETPLLALKGVVDAEALATPVTVGGEVEGAEGETEAEVVSKLLGAQLLPVHIGRVRCEPSAVVLAPKECPLLEGSSRPFEEGVGRLGVHVSLDDSRRTGCLDSADRVVVRVEPGSVAEGGGEGSRESFRGAVALVSYLTRVQDPYARPAGW